MVYTMFLTSLERDGRVQTRVSPPAHQEESKS